MKLKDLHVGQIVAVKTYGDNFKFAQIVKIGEYTKTTYSGIRSYRGIETTFKGALVAYQNHDGNFPLTKIESKRVFGKPEESYIDPFDGATVVVPATEDQYEEVEVSATQWVRPQDVLYTEDEAAAILARQRESAASKNRLAEQTANLDPCIKEILRGVGVSEYNASSYATGGEVKLSYSQFMKLVDKLDPEGTRR